MRALFAIPGRTLPGMLAAALLSSPVTRADEVSRTPPAIFREQLEPLLTPIEKVLAKKDGFTGADGIGAILLDEEVEFIDADGRRFHAEHLVYRALTEAGCKEVGKETHSLRRSDEKIHLVLARSILPDGRRIPVQDNAAFVKSPQYDAGNGLYDDSGELIIFFPNVTVGTVTESIVVREETAPRIPGQYTRRFSWRNGWPEQRTVRIVDLPRAMADRLKISTLGSGVPEPRRADAGPDRVRLTWELGRQPARPRETAMAPASQVGPSTWLTTMAGWEDFAKWYSGLLGGRAALSPELAAEVDGWTKDARSPREVLDILTRQVSRDVRYVALEFGLAGFQPADCNRVWANRYGDCKDKANLLRAMLLHKGIPAKLVLLNTEHAGSVQKASPDYRPFDHMILAAETAPGEWTYCDPTISYGAAGLISPGDADRDVLLIDEKGFSWARTPPVTAGRLTYDFDLIRDAAGELSGWMTFRADGYYATGYLSEHTGQDRREMLRAVGNRVRGFFPAAELVDLKELPVASGAFGYKAFFVVPAGASTSTTTVPFPIDSGLLPEVATETTRQTPLFQWKDEVAITMKLALPAGAGTAEPPAPYQMTSPALAATAGWKSGPGTVEASLRVSITDSLISPGEYPAFRNAIRSLRTWLDHPLVLGTSGSPASSQPAQTPDEITLENFPMMPTAEGQRTLLEKRFPPDSDPALRRKALGKIVQYFPDDAATRFHAAMNLAFLEAEAGKKAEAIRTVEKLVASAPPSLEAGWINWARYRLAFLYAETNRPEEALGIFRHLASAETTSDFRKAWSVFQTARLSREKSPQEAAAMLQAAITTDSEALAAQVTLLAELLLTGGRDDELRKSLAAVATLNSPNAETAVVRLIESADALPADQSERLLTLVEKENLAAAGPAAEALQTARNKSQSLATWRNLQNRLADFLRKHPPAVETKDLARKALAGEIDKAVKTKDADRSLALALALLAGFPPEDDFPEWLWRASTYAEWKEKVDGPGSAGPVLPLLLDLCDAIPPENENFFEGRVVRGRVLRRAGDTAETEALLAALLAHPQFPPSFEVSVRRDLGEAREAQGKYPEALENYLQLAPRIGELPSVSDLMLRAVFLQLHLGRETDALALLGKLDGVPPGVAQKAAHAFQIGGLTALAREPAKARAYWRASRRWQEDWRKLTARMGASPDPVAVPIIADLTDLGAAVGQAARSRNQDAFASGLNLAASAALWDPAMALEFAGLRETIASAHPELANDLARFTVSLAASVPPLNPDLQRRSDLIQAGAWLDAEEPDMALTVIRRSLREAPRDEIRFAMQRVWGAAALSRPKERPGAIAAIEECLALPDATAWRSLAVRILAELYHREGRTDDEEKLLERELANPRVKASPQFAGLQERRRALGAGVSTEREFGKFLADWLAVFRPTWHDFARPAALDDPRLADLEAVLEAPDSEFSPPETTKLRLLVAIDAGQPLERRLDCWDAAALALFDRLGTQEEADRFLRTIIDDKRLPEFARRRWLWLAACDSGSRRQAGRFAAYLNNPLASGFSSDQAEGIAALERVVSADAASAASLEKSFAALAAQPAGAVALDQMFELFDAMLRLGDLDAAQRMYESASALRLAPSVPRTNDAVSLDFLRRLRRARAWVPVQTALRDAVLRRFPEAGLPENTGNLREIGDSELIAVKNAQAVRLSRIRRREIDPADLWFWRNFVRGLDARKEAALRLELARIVVSTAAEDAGKSAAIKAAAAFLDCDDEGERAAFRELCQPYRDAGRWPLAARTALLEDLEIDVRAGLPLRLAEALPALRDDDAGLWQELDLTRQAGDFARLRALLDRTPADELLARDNVGSAVLAFDAAGLAEEAGLARKAGRDALYHLLLDAWSNPNRGEILGALDLADVLGESRAVPEAWQKFVGQNVRDELTRYSALCEMARLRQDWARLEPLAAKAIEKFPTYYYFFWLRGEALYSLGRKQEALAPLRTYAAHARNERQYPRAVAWIRELEGSPSAQR